MRSDLDVSVHGSRLGSSHKPFQLCSAVVLGLNSKLIYVNIFGQHV